ncbi:FANCM-MHF complex subunit Mhf2 [Ranunculus cassubicifolius]
MENENQITFDPDLIHAIFKHVWSKKARDKQRQLCFHATVNNLNFPKAEAGTSKKNRPSSANSNALKLSCELLRSFIAEAVHRAAAIAEAEGVSKIEPTHLERILPQLLLDF